MRTEGRCEWSARASDDWIQLRTTHGTGNGEVAYTVDRNRGEARVGTIVIGAQTHRIEQDAFQSTRVEFEGRVSNLSGSCPALSLTADRRHVVTDGETRFNGGNCRHLANGMEVEVEGELRRDAVVQATRIKIRKH